MCCAHDKAKFKEPVTRLPNGNLRLELCLICKVSPAYVPASVSRSEGVDRSLHLASPRLYNLQDIKAIVTSHTEAICADPHTRSHAPLFEQGLSGYAWVVV